MMFEFKDGDVCKKNNLIFIFKSYSGEHYNVHISIDSFGRISKDDKSWGIYEENNPIMLASKEEREKLFKKMELEGLRWNNRTKKVELFEQI
jgi:transcriptional regulator of NAD metabolism